MRGRAHVRRASHVDWNFIAFPSTPTRFGPDEFVHIPLEACAVQVPSLFPFVAVIVVRLSLDTLCETPGNLFRLLATCVVLSLSMRKNLGVVTGDDLAELVGVTDRLDQISVSTFHKF